MKKVLNLLFLCVCLLLIGCEKGEDIAYYTDDLLEKNEIDDVEVFLNLGHMIIKMLFGIMDYEKEKSGLPYLIKVRTL